MPVSVKAVKIPMLRMCYFGTFRGFCLDDGLMKRNPKLRISLCSDNSWLPSPRQLAQSIHRCTRLLESVRKRKTRRVLSALSRHFIYRNTERLVVPYRSCRIEASHDREMPHDRERDVSLTIQTDYHRRLASTNMTASNC